MSHRPLKLLALGDCNTRGVDDPRWGSPLVVRIAEQLQTAGIDCEPLNLGHTMTTTREGVARVIRLRSPVDVALINFGLVDSWHTSLPSLYVPYFPESLLRRSARKLVKFVKRRLRSPWVRSVLPVGPVVPLEEYVRNLRQMIDGLRGLDPGVLIILWTTVPVQHNAERNAHIERYNGRLAELAAETGCLFVDTADVLSALDEPERYWDGLHLSSRSVLRLADEVAGLLRTHIEDGRNLRTGKRHGSSGPTARRRRPDAA
jgi:lysophospholipase L1-like esterase